MIRLDTAWVRWLLIGLAGALFIAAVFALGRCGRPDAAKQAEQTTKSSNATADAAAVALNTLEGRVANESEIDRAVGAAVMEIDNANDPDAVRSIVLGRLCDTPEYRNTTCALH